jgi:hypothetical protein
VQIVCYPARRRVSCRHARHQTVWRSSVISVSFQIKNSADDVFSIQHCFVKLYLNNFIPAISRSKVFMYNALWTQIVHALTYTNTYLQLLFCIQWLERKQTIKEIYNQKQNLRYARTDDLKTYRYVKRHYISILNWHFIN